MVRKFKRRVVVAEAAAYGFASGLLAGLLWLVGVDWFVSALLAYVLAVILKTADVVAHQRSDRARVRPIDFKTEGWRVVR